MHEPTPYHCAEALRRLDGYLDRELSPEELARVREHLELCVACAEAARFEASVIRNVRATLSRLRAPESLRARVEAALVHAGPAR